MGQAKRRKPVKTSPQVSQFTWRASIESGWRSCAAVAKRVGDKFGFIWDKVARYIPLLHRRVLVVLVPIVLILLLWPSREKGPEVQEEVRRNVPIHLPEETVTEPASPQRPVQTEGARSVTEMVEAPSKPESVAPARPISTDWQQHKIADGQTLAAIFRSKGLPLKDLYAIAAIEGDDKPISRVRAGQILRFKQTESGELDVLQIERSGQEPVMYVRLSDGSFFRSDR
ncbi:LysM-like peptidoglycan-binding domain-containing protein [Thaumasiovibrio subtropicus]|uniref:LysM-like peptidoglycan-binding domain-containing protein n=1 Tax=Thaumasiovibrio subtropicus TaxID=1891207 RepID=UPI000B35E918|nr:LysM-like peptidoglycan-binding domain-containing protein [Thaumasiovibrio subtropicus]